MTGSQSEGGDCDVVMRVCYGQTSRTITLFYRDEFCYVSFIKLAPYGTAG